MRGVAQATAAITIVNALSTGIGSAVGIGLRATAEIELEPQEESAPLQFDVDPSSDSPLVRATLAEAGATFAPGRSFRGSLRVLSEIPPARGLKSSSAVSSAVAAAFADAVGANAPPLDVARLSAGVSRRIGLSATGAFDDAMAGLRGGFVVTDNRRDAVLRRDPADPAWRILLLIPPGQHLPSPRWSTEFARRATEGRVAAEMALSGDYFGAMERNTELVESALGWDLRHLRERLADAGALASGVSGLGPTLAAIVPLPDLEGAMDALPSDAGERLVVKVVPPEQDLRGLLQ